MTSVTVLGALAANGCGGDDTTNGSTGGTTTTTGTTTGAGGATGSSSSSAGGGGGSTTSTTTTGTGTGGGGTGGSADCSPAAGAEVPLKLTEIATGLSSPVLAKGAGNDATRLYIVEQSGTIRIVKDGVLLPTPFLDVDAATNGDFTFGGERGFLGLAFHPDYEQNGRFFVHYSDGGGDTKIEEYHRSADPDVADPTPVGTVLTVNQPESNHNGGSIEFGADGMLYIFLGDGGGGGDQHGQIGNGQNLNTLLGKVSRIDVTTLPYAVPAGNFQGGSPEIWDYGVRNPWRASFDVCTGDLYIGEVGQNAWEEIDVEPAGQGGKNYGWRCREGMHDYNQNCGPNAGTAVDPVIEYPHAGDCSVSGGYVYRGSAIPSLRGTYFYGDYCSGHIWSFVWSNGQISGETDRSDDLQSNGMNISSFGQDVDGEVYVVDHGGTVYRIDAE